MNIGYANPNPVFQPAMRLVAAITNSNPAIVTTTFNHNYLSGAWVRLYVPRACGMWQADKLYGQISVTGPTTFTVDIDTTAFDPFIAPPVQPPPPPPIIPLPNPHINTCALVIPIGENNDNLDSAVNNVLPTP
jgi:hypothetical protein